MVWVIIFLKIIQLVKKEIWYLVVNMCTALNCFLRRSCFVRSELVIGLYKVLASFRDKLQLVYMYI